jgi:hypothetical protein
MSKPPLLSRSNLFYLGMLTSSVVHIVTQHYYEWWYWWTH